jgi:CubicO group peptidase (beta-lactamase class C family)
MMSSAGAGSAGSTAAPSSSVVAQWRAAVRSVGIVGASLGIVQGDDIVEVAHEGLSDVLARRPVDDETIYHWASITKTFTAVAVMQLRDGGRLSLDDPVVRYLPELRAVHNPHGSVEAITIRHLLSHTAGFRSPTWPWGSGRPWHPFEPPGWAQLAAMLPYTEVEFPPGSRFQYSNPGIVFLGRIVETLSGEDFETYVDKRIFTPLGMAGSYFDLTAPYRLPHRSHSYVVRDGVRTEQPFDFDTGVTVSNGGLNAPLADLLTWLRFLAGRPGSAAARARYDAVLARASLEEMWRPQIDAPDQDEAPDRPVKAGLVFFLETHVGRTYVAHSGHQNGFASHLYLDPERGVGYVVAFNTFVARTAATPRGTDAVDRELRDALFTSVFPAVASR